MELDLARIKKISIISLAALLISGMLSFIFFIGTLFFYFRAYLNKPPNILKYILPIFAAKIAFSGLAFFLIYRFDYINMLGFLFSFLIFFTIFFNLEIF